MPKLATSYIKICLSLSISIALVAWLVATLDWRRVLEELQTAHYWILFPVTISTLLHFILRALRWKYLLPRPPELPQRKLFDAIMIGNLATFILPLRAGEFIRPLALVKTTKNQLTFSVTFSSIVTERLFDLICVLLSFVIILPLLPTLPDWVAQGAFYLSILAAIILILLAWSIFNPSSVTAFSAFFCKPLPKKINQHIQIILAEMLKGAEVLRNKSNLIIVIFLTLAIWLLNYLSMFIALFMFSNIEPTILLAVTTSVILALAVAAPSAPGFIGILQAATVAGFTLFGQSAEVATSYAIILHVLQYLMFFILGGWALSKNGLALGNLNTQS